MQLQLASMCDLFRQERHRQALILVGQRLALGGGGGVECHGLLPGERKEQYTLQQHRGVLWWCCGVVKCDVVVLWCGVVQCSVVWCGVP
jgi:hypothetical protein